MNTTIPVALRIPGLHYPMQMFVHGPTDQHVSRKIARDGIWEPFETSLLVELLNPGDVFVDVGANIGYFTLVGASLVGAHGKVFAFEPDPANFALLERNCSYNFLQARVHAARAGLSDKNREGRLYLSEDNLGDHQIFPTATRRRQLDIQLHQGAQYLHGQLAKFGLQSIDFIKVDTQGSECEVMRGLMPLLLEQVNKPSLLIELTPYSLRQCGSSGRELIELLARLGQAFWIVDHIEHQLVASSAAELAQWCDDVDAVGGDEGFMNILVADEKACTG